MTGIVLAPELPLEEVFFLAFLCYLTMILVSPALLAWVLGTGAPPGAAPHVNYTRGARRRPRAVRRRGMSFLELTWSSSAWRSPPCRRAAVAAGTAAHPRGCRPDRRRPVVLTAVFDNVMIAAGLFDLRPATHLAGLRIGLRPVEDFAYPLAGAPAAARALAAAHRRRPPSTFGRPTAGAARR